MEESGRSYVSTTFVVNEPLVARQILPYLWGPDDNGTIFGCGDPLRPGTLYFAKANNPDAAPDANTLELIDPSAPLIGGGILNGVSLVSGASDWWAIYPAFSGGVAYSKIRRDVGRTMIAPFAHDSDGQRIFFWAKDCIAYTSGGAYVDLTSTNPDGTPGDLYPVFPHGGVQGSDVTVGGVTVSAPDYSRAYSFRLQISNNRLYADYQDSQGSPHTLVYDVTNTSWVVDVYNDPITVHLAPRMQTGKLLSTGGTPYATLVMGDSNGKSWTTQDAHNDNLIGISGKVGTFEFDGGDLRMQPKFGDLYLDIVAPAGASVQPVSLGVAIAGVAATIVGASPARQFLPISVGGNSIQKAVGLLIGWTDDFTIQSAPTVLNGWQPSLTAQPEITTDRFGDWS
jgi:hypothetical protein